MKRNFNVRIFLPFGVIGGLFLMKGIASLDPEWLWSGGAMWAVGFFLEWQDSKERDEFYK